MAPTPTATCFRWRSSAISALAGTLTLALLPACDEPIESGASAPQACDGSAEVAGIRVRRQTDPPACRATMEGWEGDACQICTVQIEQKSGPFAVYQVVGLSAGSTVMPARGAIHTAAGSGTAHVSADCSRGPEIETGRFRIRMWKVEPPDPPLPSDFDPYEGEPTCVSDFDYRKEVPEPEGD